MGWEWRVFFENNNADPADTFCVLNNAHHRTTYEERADVYQSLQHACLGLKVRGKGGKTAIINKSDDHDGSCQQQQQQYELKVRIETKQDGWERWTKRHVYSDAMSSLQTRLVDVLRNLNQPSLQSHVQDFLSLKKSANDDLVPIHVTKRRVQFYHQGALLEQTDLEICVHNNDNVVKTGKKKQYRSICVDGHGSNDLPAQILDRMGAELRSKAVVCGYPEFLERFLLEVTSSDDKSP